MLEGKRKKELGRSVRKNGERERYYNRNGWGICAKEINDEENNKTCIDLLEMEKIIQKQYEDSKIRESTQIQQKI